MNPETTLESTIQHQNHYGLILKSSETYTAGIGQKNTTSQKVDKLKRRGATDLCASCDFERGDAGLDCRVGEGVNPGGVLQPTTAFKNLALSESNLPVGVPRRIPSSKLRPRKSKTDGYIEAVYY